jgi:HTH-type transcriptional regulator, competence development regulator
MMKKPDRGTLEWLEYMAAAEDRGGVSVGGLALKLQQPETGNEAKSSLLRSLTFARLIQLSRRQRRWSVQRLAECADVNVAEILMIEEGEPTKIAPRTVYQLGNALGLSVKKLMVISGLATARDSLFEEKTLQFAARSETVEQLSSEEREALEDFVRFLAE